MTKARGGSANGAPGTGGGPVIGGPPTARETSSPSSLWDRARCRPDLAGRWDVRWVETTGSTNDDLVTLAAQGVADRTVLVADLQTAGRGRMGRSWHAPSGAALTFSALLRPSGVPPARRGWVGALLGLAVVAGIRRRTGVRAGLKWPNDLLIDGRKAAGILAALVGPALVVGAGLNVTLRQEELPSPDATSLLLAGVDPGLLRREELLAAILDEFAPRLDRWSASGGDVVSSGLLAEYLDGCVSVGREVTIQLPDGSALGGTAVDIASDGSIVIDDGSERRRFAAGDVVHLRAADSAVDRRDTR